MELRDRWELRLEGERWLSETCDDVVSLYWEPWHFDAYPSQSIDVFAFCLGFDEALDRLGN